MSIQLRIKEIVEAEPNKYSQADVARMIGISRQRLCYRINKSDMVGLKALVKERGKPLCIDCGRPLSDHKYKRCRACHIRELEKRKVVLICDNCGTEFRRYPREIKGKKFHFCSNPCKQAFLGKYMSKAGKMDYWDRKLRDRDIVRLQRETELTTEEIANRLNISTRTVQRVLKRVGK